MTFIQILEYLNSVYIKIIKGESMVWYRLNYDAYHPGYDEVRRIVEEELKLMGIDYCRFSVGSNISDIFLGFFTTREVILEVYIEDISQGIKLLENRLQKALDNSNNGWAEIEVNLEK